MFTPGCVLLPQKRLFSCWFPLRPLPLSGWFPFKAAICGCPNSDRCPLRRRETGARTGLKAKVGRPEKRETEPKAAAVRKIVDLFWYGCKREVKHEANQEGSEMLRHPTVTPLELKARPAELWDPGSKCPSAVLRRRAAATDLFGC